MGEIPLTALPRPRQHDVKGATEVVVVLAAHGTRREQGGIPSLPLKHDVFRELGLNDSVPKAGRRCLRSMLK